MRILIYFLLIIFLSACSDVPIQDHNWNHYLGDTHSAQYSPLNQITSSNVAQLKLAWTYDAGEADVDNRSQIQCNPLVIDGIIYGSTAKLKLFALDATTGEEIWNFDAFDGEYEMLGMGVNRGLAWYDAGDESKLFFSAGSKLFAIDPSDGKPISSFGENGAVDFHVGLEREIDDLFIVSNTPGIIYKDLLIIGSRVSEATGAAPGHI